MELKQLILDRGFLICIKCRTPILPFNKYWQSEIGNHHDQCRPEGQVVIKLECSDNVQVLSEGR